MAEGGGRQPIRNVAPGGVGVPDLGQQTLLREFQRMLWNELESFNECLEPVEERD
ncbi:hypothetical protein PVK06_046612 [Gossypium arboreum]|uniref:Uncharacterized protein n=1 Tax=Gossypium arboreum TaxID=29729 RepID=A0ABR0MCZ4_GOSAR|nr:hypothetical protein PVK06_046612 [Gossypium arboreum]